MKDSIEQECIKKLCSLQKPQLEAIFPLSEGPIQQENGKAVFYRLYGNDETFFTAIRSVDQDFFKSVNLHCKGFYRVASQNNYSELQSLAEHLVREMFNPS